MKFLKYFLIWLCMLMLLVCVAGYVYIRLEGKSLFENRFSKFFGQETTIKSVRYLVPFGVRFHQLEIRNVIEAEDVFLHLRIPFLLDKQFIIARLELVKPIFYLVRHDQEQLDFGGAYLARQEARFNVPQQNLKSIKGVLIDFLSVKDGQFEVLDLSVEDPVKYAIGKVNGKALKFVYPLRNQNIKFDVEGTVINFGDKKWLAKSYVSANGWVNWKKRDMEAELNFEGIRGVSSVVNLKSKNNELSGKGYFKVAPLSEEEQATVPQTDDVLNNTLFSILDQAQAEIVLNFGFQTSMDAFQLEAVDFDGDIELPHEKKVFDLLNPAFLFGGMKEEAGSN